jgi:hypothetical protein
MRKIFIIFPALAVAVAGGAFASSASADHAWGPYHWARTSSPFTLQLGDNVSGAWDASLAQASADWSLSSVLDTLVVPGSSNPKNCRATLGRVEVCNSKYGRNGWLGIATIWASGGHITQGTVKLNDTYFNTPTYNTPAWRNLVMCQEVGHTFGLHHQDENFSNAPLGTCMDYSNDPEPNQHPNQHDYDMLETIYEHLDATDTAVTSTKSSQGRQVDHNDPSSWGRAIRTTSDGRGALYMRDFGNGEKVFNFVFWVDGEDHAY